MQAFLQQYGQMIGFGLLVLLLVRSSIDFGAAFTWLRSLRLPWSSAPGPSTPTTDPETAALQATKYLLQYFKQRNCKAGITAAQTCGQHLLDHGDEGTS